MYVMSILKEMNLTMDYKRKFSSRTIDRHDFSRGAVLVARTVIDNSDLYLTNFEIILISDARASKYVDA